MVRHYLYSLNFIIPYVRESYENTGQHLKRIHHRIGLLGIIILMLPILFGFIWRQDKKERPKPEGSGL